MKINALDLSQTSAFEHRFYLYIRRMQDILPVSFKDGILWQKAVTVRRIDKKRIFV